MHEREKSETLGKLEKKLVHSYNNVKVMNLLMRSFVFFFPQDEELYEQASDVRTQLKFFEQLEKIEKQRKDDEERELLMKAAKVGLSDAGVAVGASLPISALLVNVGFSRTCWPLFKRNRFCF